jgi:hypothetical protein
MSAFWGLKLTAKVDGFARLAGTGSVTPAFQPAVTGRL